MTLIERVVARLKSVPVTDGTMFDNTMFFYFPDGGLKNINQEGPIQQFLG